MDDIVPEEERFRYNKTADQISSTSRSARARSALYSGAVAATVLRCLHEIFQADEGGLVDVVVVNAFVDTTDPSTGKRIQPYLISVRTTRGQFAEFSLANVDPVQCLKRLSASVSRSPAELAPVKPIVDINMSDPRFIEEADVLSTLDSRPNLMELTPSEFESLITNLFEKMGLETKLTQASRDGGVDCVAFDLRPVLGGKVIVQAKRYKNTVGVSAVRDLFGTVHNEGASKGILVTTSGYGSATFDFAKGKPIELIDGANLLYLLSEHAGIEAKIVAPDDWVDPRSDTPISSI
jgi:restriction system protein